MSEPMMTFPLNTSDILKSAALRYPEQEIVSMLADLSVHRYTYADAYKRACRVANFLASVGSITHALACLGCQPFALPRRRTIIELKRKLKVGL